MYDTITDKNGHYGMFLPFQKVAVELLDGSQDYVELVRATYKRRGELLVSGLNEIGWNIEKPSGSMFVWAPIPSNYTSSLQFTLDLMEKAGVIVVPGSSFGSQGEGFVRIALVEQEERIISAVEYIKNSNILNNIKM